MSRSNRLHGGRLQGMWRLEWPQDTVLTMLEVARKTSVDDFTVLAIGSCLLRNLSNILSPKVIDRLDNTTIQEIAAEIIESRGERARLTEKLENLRLALKTLHRHDRHKPMGMFVLVDLASKAF